MITEMKLTFNESPMSKENWRPSVILNFYYLCMCVFMYVYTVFAWQEATCPTRKYSIHLYPFSYLILEYLLCLHFRWQSSFWKREKKSTKRVSWEPGCSLSWSRPNHLRELGFPQQSTIARPDCGCLLQKSALVKGLKCFSEYVEEYFGMSNMQAVFSQLIVKPFLLLENWLENNFTWKSIVLWCLKQ